MRVVCFHKTDSNKKKYAYLPYSELVSLVRSPDTENKTSKLVINKLVFKLKMKNKY